MGLFYKHKIKRNVFFFVELIDLVKSKLNILQIFTLSNDGFFF